MKKILAIVVTYFPEKELLYKNISAFIDYVDRVLIWENTPEQEKLNYRFIEHEKVEYHGDGINSISHGLNYGWQYAKKHGYDYLLTMDQDSLWQDFPSYISLTVNNPEVPIGIWGPNAYGENVEEKIVKFDKIITSGMLTKTELISKVGGWNEIFSIDCVDDEFCLYANTKGINSYVFGMCRLHQQYGTPKKVSVLGRSAIISYDSPQRLYSIYKSHVIQLKLFPKVECIRSEFWNYWIPKIKWGVIGGNKPISNFWAIFKGILSGLCFRPKLNNVRVYTADGK